MSDAGMEEVRARLDDVESGTEGGDEIGSEKKALQTLAKCKATS